MQRFPKPKLWKPSNPHKYIGDINNIVSRSSWEMKFMRWADTNPSVLKWGSETQFIPYIDKNDNRVHRYFPDFFIKIKTKEGTEKYLIIEIKPDTQTKPPNKPRRITSKSQSRYLTECTTYIKNQSKWAAADEFAKKHGWEFIVMTEYHLGLKKK